MPKASRTKHVSLSTSSSISLSITDRDNPKQTPSDKKGFPTYAQYKAVEQAYIESICPKKRVKSVISRTDFADILRVLDDPFCTSIRDASFRFWVRRTFTLGDFREPSGVLRTDTVLHHGVPVVMQDDIYDTLCYLHGRANHGGRDKTCKEVRSHRSYLHKALVGMFVAICPTCQRRRSVGTTKEAVKISNKENQNCLDNDDAFDDDETLVEGTPRSTKATPPGDSSMNSFDKPMQSQKDPQLSPMSLKPAANPELILSAPWPPTESPDDFQPPVNEQPPMSSVLTSKPSSRSLLPPLVLLSGHSSHSRSALPSPFTLTQSSQLGFESCAASPISSQFLENIDSSTFSSASSFNRMSIASILDAPLPSSNSNASPRDWDSDPNEPHVDCHSSKRTAAAFDAGHEVSFPSLPVKNRVKRARDHRSGQNTPDSIDTMIIDPILVESSRTASALSSRSQSRSMSPLELLAAVSVDALETQSQASDSPQTLIGPACGRLVAAQW
jgi:hypothetical protein